MKNKFIITITVIFAFLFLGYLLYEEGKEMDRTAKEVGFYETQK